MGAGKAKAPLWVVLAVLLTGCGGSGSSGAERTKLVNKLSAQTRSLPSDLGQCVDSRARDLPISQLRDLANAGNNPSHATREAALRILNRCVQAGKGVSGFRSIIVSEVSSTVPKAVPASFKVCLEDRAKRISPDQLSQIVSAAVTGGATAARATGERLGRSLARRCLDQPGVLTGLRTVFLAPIEKFVRTSHFSSAFRYCVLRKAEQISLAQLKQFALDQVAGRSVGVALGKRFARACIASGARP